MRLYENLVSGNCYEVRLLLARLGVAYERVRVDVVDRSNRNELPAVRAWLDRVASLPGHVPIDAAA